MLEFTDRVSRPVSMPTQDMTISKDDGTNRRYMVEEQGLGNLSPVCANYGVMVHFPGTLERKGEAGAWAAMSRWTTTKKKRGRRVPLPDS